MSHVWTGEGPRGRRRSDRLQVALVISLLLSIEFYFRPSVIDGRGMPDFLLLSLLLMAIRLPPGYAAVVGLAAGFLIDVLSPAKFGANILAHVLIGWGAAWGRAVFFADNLVVNAALFFGATWVRNMLVLLLSGTGMARLGAEAVIWGPLQGATTAITGVVVVILFRERLAIRIEP